MDKQKAAKELFNSGFNCAQAVFAVFDNDFGLKRETALKVSAAFGGGICRTGNICGAVSGALMAIGMKYGQTDAARPQDKSNTYAKGKEFMDAFRAKNGSCECKNLLSCDLSTPEGQAKVKELGLHDKVCSKAVMSAIEIVEKMI
jgi:C_GCAxxG_C_C family probable redox protein